MTCSKGLGIFLIILLAYSNILSQQESCHKEVESLHRNINSLKSIKEQPVLEKNISLLYELRKTHTCLNSDYKYNQLLFTYYLSEGTLDSTIKYARIINSIDGVNLTLKANNESKFSDFLYRHLFIDSSYKYAQSALNKYQKLENDEGIIICYRILSSIYLSKGQKEKCVYYYNKAINLADTTLPSLEIGLLYSDQGLLNYQEGNYDDALGFAIKALNIFKKINSNKFVAITYNRIAIIMGKLELTDDAIKYLLNGLEEAKKNNDPYVLAVLANNLGIIYAKEEKDSLALEYLKEALEYFNKKTDATGRASCYATIGDILFKVEIYKKRPI